MLFLSAFTLVTFMSASMPQAPMVTNQMFFEPDAKPIEHKPPVPGQKYIPVLELNDAVMPWTVKPLIDEIALDNKDKAEAIVLVINSPGGSVYDGWDLAKAIEASEAPVTCIVDTLAASMAFVILESCHTRIMTKRSLLMAHEPSGATRGQPQQVRQFLKRLDALSDTLIEHMCVRTKLSFKQFKAKIRYGQEYWMTWREAKRISAVDKVIVSSQDYIKKLK